MSRSTLVRTLAALALSVSLVACGDDDEDLPPDGGGSIRDLGPELGPTDGGGSNLGPDVGTEPTDGSPVDANLADGEVADGGSCLGARDCWSCALTLTRHFLNGCTSAECSPFDNAARLPLLNADGSLPPLP